MNEHFEKCLEYLRFNIYSYSEVFNEWFYIAVSVKTFKRKNQIFFFCGKFSNSLL